MMHNLQTQESVLLKASLEKNQEQTCHNVCVVRHKSQTSKTNLTKHDNLRPNE